MSEFQFVAQRLEESCGLSQLWVVRKIVSMPSVAAMSVLSLCGVVRVDGDGVLGCRVLGCRVTECVRKAFGPVEVRAERVTTSADSDISCRWPHASPV